MPRENVELVRAIFEHTYTVETLDAVLDRYHPDLVYHPRAEDPEPETLTGRDQWRALIRDYIDALSEIRFEILEVAEVGDRVILSTILHGRGRASGLDVAEPYVMVCAVRDGQVVEGWEFRTVEEALALTGQ